MSRTLKYALSLIGGISTINFAIFFTAYTLIGLYRFSLATSSILLIVAGLISAALITIVIVVTAPVLRDYLATLRRLWRLENLSHPVLVRLAQEAPSTYHHSIIVANMAHKAAKAIGADPILARLGGYYHDVGKLAQPDLYIENSPDRNLLEEANPRKAAQWITRHVKEGVKLAKQYDFPPEITAFITQHHGTTMVSTFYEKAKSQGLQVEKQEFRYPGPKPLSKEAAILMLSDGIEAKVRTLQELTDKSIAQAVDSIIEDKTAAGQLELCGISVRDLRKARSAFIESIKIMHHRRIKYTKSDENIEAIEQT